ncbi:MAG: hypothetical protein K2J57_02725 [Bacteroidales bacterium]|nr:hypothetical protein [Bacteroidales bacterium]
MKTIFHTSLILFTTLLLFSCKREQGGEKMKSVYYQASEIKPGDYYYSDGSWSDGGLREWRIDSLVIENPKPLPLAGKRVIGIVFQVDSSRIGCREKESLKEIGIQQPRGLAMAVECVEKGKACMWDGWGQKVGSIIETSMKECFFDIDGLAATEEYENRFPENPAIAAVIKFNKKDSLPYKRTPWFVPSTGQWWDILQNLGGAGILATEWAQNENIRGAVFWNRQYNVCDHLNFWMQGIPEEEKNLFGSKYDHYWSSSEFNRFRQRYIGIINKEGYLYMAWDAKGCRHKVRCVFAF